MEQSDKRNVPSWFLHQALKDPELLEELKESVFGVAKPKDYFLDKYLIPDEVINSYFVIDDEGVPSSAGIFDIDDAGNAINLRISKHITKKEYEDGWKFVQWYKKNRLFLDTNKTKRKSPQYPELLYAVYKARHLEKKLTFRQIFELYQTNELAYYDKKVQPFKDEESLERYYRKYTPTP